MISTMQSTWQLDQRTYHMRSVPWVSPLDYVCILVFKNSFLPRKLWWLMSLPYFTCYFVTVFPYLQWSEGVNFTTVYISVSLFAVIGGWPSINLSIDLDSITLTFECNYSITKCLHWEITVSCFSFPMPHINDWHLFAFAPDWFLGNISLSRDSLPVNYSSMPNEEYIYIYIYIYICIYIYMCVCVCVCVRQWTLDHYLSR